MSLQLTSASPRCTCCKCQCDIYAYFQDKKLIQFLMGLNESYTQVRGNILMITPIIHFWCKKKDRGRLKIVLGFKVKEPHLMPAQPVQSSNRTEKARREKEPTLCKRSGHTEEKC